VEYEIEKTEIFDKWLKKLRDRQAVVAIAKRLGRAKLGNFGDVEPVGGGDKSSQKKGIKKAKELVQRQ
jgi:putative component of toxin-antitoxin plasmid stabilization module